MNSNYRSTKQAIMACTLGFVGTTFAATSEKYTYDASGNIITKNINGAITSMSYDVSNKIISSGGARYHYDQSGRPIAVQKDGERELKKIVYGYSDKVIDVTEGEKRTEFFYNAEGHLVGKVSGKEGNSYAWDGIILAAEGDRAFTNEAAVTGGVPVIQGENDVIVSDYLGNTLLDANHNFDGSAFGEGLEEGRFTSKLYVKEMGAFLFPHRLYSPESSNWTVPDPVGFPDGRNQYAYVGADPLSRVDPLGTTWTPYSQFDTPGSPYDTTVQTVQVSPTITEDSYWHITLSKKTPRYFSQNIPTGGSVTISSSATTSVTVSGSVTLFKAVTFGISGTASGTTGLSATVQPHGTDPSKVEVFAEAAVAQKYVQYTSPNYPNGGGYSASATQPITGYTISILGLPMYEH